MNVVKQNNNKRDTPFHPTFLGWITQWLGLILFPTIIMFELSFFLFPFTGQELSFTQSILLQFLGTIPFIILCFPVLFYTLPFKPINFSMKGIFKSFLHIFLFILFLPILAIFLLIYYIIFANFIGFSNNQLAILVFSCFLIIPCIFWFLFALFFVEKILGKNSSVILARIRYVNRKNKMIKNQSNNDTLTNQSDHFRYSKRWITITFSVPFLLIFSLFFLDIQNHLFLFGIITVLSIDLLIFLFTAPLYKSFPNSPKHIIDILDICYTNIFGEEDISSKALGCEFILIFIIGGMILPAVKLVTYPIILIFFLIYLFLIISFFIVIWSNQLKSFFQKINR